MQRCERGEKLKGKGLKNEKGIAAKIKCGSESSHCIFDVGLKER